MPDRTSRRRRGCLVALVAALVLTVAVVFGFRRVLDSGAFRAGAEARLSAALGRPVTVGTIDIDWLPVPAIVGRDITVGGAGEAAPSLALEAIRVVPRLSSLLSRPVVADRVELVGLTVNVLRTGDGRWLMPVAVLPEGEAGPAAFDVRQVLLKDGRIRVTDERRPETASRPPSIRDIQAAVHRQDSVTKLDGLSGTVGRSALSGSGVIGPQGLRLSLAWSRLRAEDLPEALGLAGIAAPAELSIEGDRPLTLDVAIDAAGGLAASGQVSASTVRLGTLTLTSLRAPLRLSAGRLSLEPLAFSAYGGKESGRLRADLGATPLAWSLDTRIDGVDMRQLVNASTSVKDRLSGTGSFRGRLEGTAAEPLLDRARGTMSVAIADGALHDFPLLAAVNSALLIAERGTGDLRFDRLTATLAVAGGRAATNDLLATSGEMTVAAEGTLGFDQSLDFRGRVTLSREKVAELVRRQREVARLKNSDGEIELPVIVSGTVAAPRFSIDTAALLRRGLEDELQRRLKKGLGGLIK